MAVTEKKRADVVTGKPVTIVNGFALVKSGRNKLTTSNVGVENEPLRASFDAMRSRVAQALKKPGIDKKAIFKGQKDVYAYSLDPTQPGLVIRTAADGKQTIGRLLGVKFVANKRKQ